MNADAFRYLYDYHFAENRKIWNRHIQPMPQAQFIQADAYSIGSVRNQIVHLISCDETWFSPLRGLEVPEPLNPEDYADKAKIRQYWDKVEQEMRDYLATLRDEMLFTKPFPAGEDENLMLWQVLLHVVNHGTDHRAQILRLINDLGQRTGPQDFIFHVYENP